MIGRTIAVIIALFFISIPVSASTLTVDFELPEFNVANYNAPYVAIWIEAESNETLLLWHMESQGKDKWLKDIRRWWRKLGRYGETLDGVTGATKGAGKYSESLQLPNVSQFTFYMEVVREDGGRTLLKQDIDLADEKQTYYFEPENEIASLTLSIGK